MKTSAALSPSTRAFTLSPSTSTEDAGGGAKLGVRGPAPGPTPPPSAARGRRGSPAAALPALGFRVMETVAKQDCRKKPRPSVAEEWVLSEKSWIVRLPG